MSASQGPPGHLPEELEEQVLEILEGDDAARDAALDELVRRHPEHAASIHDWLVAAGAIEGDWHGREAGDDDEAEPADGETLPRRVGAYVLQAVIGRGGFGTVYRAEQQEPIRRPVAVKVLNPGMDSREVLARFSAEREALNRMDHPGIARLLDAGTTAKGLPFFVMELVEGPPLVTWCRREMLPMRARIRLFLRVCDAMQHAHQKAVLHRDLSSNNVLLAPPALPPDRPHDKTHDGPDAVDPMGQPKIIDFGIAKSLADPLLQGGAMTFRGTLMGTPEFMSPEQAAGRTDDVDTRADVYALGVQLYELLTDQLPIPGVVLRAQGIAGMAQVIARHQPARASDVAPRPRRNMLRGDLDAILQKALAKDLDQRYDSVGELADDLRRHLADEPVEVATPTTWYRLRKFVRRNRAQSIVLAVAFAAVATTLVFLALALSAANREARLRQEANRALQEKADAGFRLLANEERLARARDTESELPPPWPAHLDAYDAWREQYAARLRGERDKVTERLRALDEQRAAAGGELRDEVDRHLYNALVRLRAALGEFLGPDGPAARVAARRAWGRSALGGDARAADDERWARARDAVRRSDGERAHADYAGLLLPALPGLVPLGCHPRTKLWEFLDLRTHAPEYPLPTRDPATGDVLTDAGTGVVFVLLPPGRLAMGARRNQPGMDRNDDDAAIDELNDDIVTLDAFLVARTELTVVQFARLTGRDRQMLDPQLPLRDVDWSTATTELRRWGMLLPTEAQWEYACRARTTTPWWCGRDAECAARVGWVEGDVSRVAQLPSNPFGLFDVHGNVAEWCRDEKLPYLDFAAHSGDGLRARPEPLADAWRVVRGGSVHDGAVGCRSTARSARQPDARDDALGVRPVRPLIR